MSITKKPRRMARQPQANAGEGIEDGKQVTAFPEKRITKQSLVLELLQREGGASLAAIIGVTGWLPHTARAALTGLRKKRYAIERISLEGETRYTITPVVRE